MVSKFVNTINTYLARGIDKGYREGIKSIIALSKKHKFSDPNRLYRINYSSHDAEAILNFKMEAFTVAGIGSYDLEEKLKALGIKVHEGSIPDFDTFELEARNVMMQYGIGLGDQPPTGWLETNLNTAITSSISAARWNRLNDPDVTDLYPALQYNTQRDDRVREEHEVLDRKTYMKEDPVWEIIMPPNGWNCRCYVTPVAVTEMEDYEIAPKTDKSQREDLSQEVDPNFRRNPGQSNSIWGKWMKSELKNMPAGQSAKLKQMLKDYYNTL